MRSRCSLIEQRIQRETSGTQGTRWECHRTCPAGSAAFSPGQWHACTWIVRGALQSDASIRATAADRSTQLQLSCGVNPSPAQLSRRAASGLHPCYFCMQLRPPCQGPMQQTQWCAWPCRCRTCAITFLELYVPLSTQMVHRET